MKRKKKKKIKSLIKYKKMKIYYVKIIFIIPLNKLISLLNTINKHMLNSII